MEQDAEPVVVEVAEPVAASFDLFDGQVQSFGGAVGSAGAVVVEDLGLPFGEGPPEASDFLYPVVSASGDGFVQPEFGGLGVWLGGGWFVDLGFCVVRGCFGALM